MVEATQNPVVSAATKRWILFVATFGSFMGPFDSSVVNLAIPSIGKALGGSIESLSWIITSYLIVITSINLISGRLADIRGRKNTYVIGIGVFVTASAMCSFAPSVPALIGTRMVQALGAGNDVRKCSSLALNILPRERTWAGSWYPDCLRYTLGFRLVHRPAAFLFNTLDGARFSTSTSLLESSLW